MASSFAFLKAKPGLRLLTEEVEFELADTICLSIFETADDDDDIVMTKRRTEAGDYKEW